jgi:hypothetical protein
VPPPNQVSIKWGTFNFEIFTVMKIQDEVFWVVSPCSVVVGYQHFRGPCCLHLVKIQFEVFWAAMPHSVVVGYQCFRGPCCLHLVKIQVEVFWAVTPCSVVVGYQCSETMISYQNCIFMVFQSLRLGLSGYLASLRETRNSHRILIWKPGNQPF